MKCTIANFTQSEPLYINLSMKIARVGSSEVVVVRYVANYNFQVASSF